MTCRRDPRRRRRAGCQGPSKTWRKYPRAHQHMLGLGTSTNRKLCCYSTTPLEISPLPRVSGLVLGIRRLYRRLHHEHFNRHIGTQIHSCGVSDSQFQQTFRFPPALPLLYLAPLGWTAAPCEAETTSAWQQVPFPLISASEHWLTQSSPHMCLRRRRCWQVQLDHLPGQRCLRDKQDPVRPPSNHDSTQYWNSRKCHNHHRRYFCLAPRTKYAAEGNTN